MYSFKRFVLFAASLSVFMFAQNARADRALIVAIDTYPDLVDADLEKAGANSVPAIKNTLLANGFPESGITVITNQNATRKQILGSMDTIKTGIQPGERFVFYFLGHGGRALDRPVILPSDATMNVDSPDIDKTTLATRLSSIASKGCATTALLDTCFAAGLIASSSTKEAIRRYPSRRALFYDRVALRSRKYTKFVPVNDEDKPEGSGICYFVASDKTEQAFVDNLDGHIMGVFTHALSQCLTRTTQQSWGDIHRQVTAETAHDTDDVQHPVLSDGWYDVVPFKTKKGPMPKPAPNIEELMNIDRSNHSKFHLTMTPNKAQLATGERFSFEATTTTTGYLVLLSRTAKGAIEVLYPQSMKTEDALLHAGGVQRLPSEDFYAPDHVGTEHAKAFLFTSQQAAEEILSKFRQPAAQHKRILSSSSNHSKVNDRDLHAETIRIVPAKVSDFYTFNILLEVRDDNQ